MSRHLYLSPHLDDAILSCGGRIARDTRAGALVEVLTVFAGDEPAASASPLVDRVFGFWQLEPGRVMASRRAEDLAACDRLGARVIWWDELEAIHRRGPGPAPAPADTAPLYDDLALLYGPIAPPEEALVDALADRFAALPAADRIVAPLGVGGHVDHRIVRAAAERAFGGRLELYEEFPYVIWKWLALRRARGPRRLWTAESTPLSPADVDARIGAIGCYASQVKPMFRDDGRMAAAVRRHVRRAGGERVWRRRDAGRERERE
jgi:LmbE family N-acetylglucosaminyl deacetylase